MEHNINKLLNELEKVKGFLNNSEKQEDIEYNLQRIERIKEEIRSEVELILKKV